MILRLWLSSLSFVEVWQKVKDKDYLEEQSNPPWAEWRGDMNRPTKNHWTRTLNIPVQNSFREVSALQNGWFFRKFQNGLWPPPPPPDSFVMIFKQIQINGWSCWFWHSYLKNKNLGYFWMWEVLKPVLTNHHGMRGGEAKLGRFELWIIVMIALMMLMMIWQSEWPSLLLNVKKSHNSSADQPPCSGYDQERQNLASLSSLHVWIIVSQPFVSLSSGGERWAFVNSFTQGCIQETLKSDAMGGVSKEKMMGHISGLAFSEEAFQNISF